MPLQNLEMQPVRLTSSQKYIIEKSIIKFTIEAAHYQLLHSQA